MYVRVTDDVITTIHLLWVRGPNIFFNASLARNNEMSVEVKTT